TSGGARWNIIAGYGAQVKLGKTPDQGIDYLRALFTHVPVQAKSAREALQAFVGGKGDAMLAYENEAITAQQKGEQIDYVIPDATILIENPIAVTTPAANPQKAQAFVSFLRSADGQRIFGKAGYRPVAKDIASEFQAQFPTPPKLFTIDDLGGWPSVDSKFFDRQSGVIAELF